MEQQIERIPRWHPVIRALVFLVAYFVVVGIVEAGLLAMLASANDLTLQEVQQLVLGGENFGYFALIKGIELGMLIVMAWFFARTLDRIRVKDFGLDWHFREFWVGAGYGVSLIVGAYLLFLIFGLARITGVGPAGGNIGSWIVQVGLGFVTFVFVALQEEILLRGYILRNFMKSMNNVVALVIMALLFTGMHAFNPNLEILGLVNIFLAGILFGVYYIHRKNLWFPIGLHLTWNFFQGNILGVPVSGQPMPSVLNTRISGPEILTGANFGIEGSVVGTVILITAIIGFQFYYGRNPGIPE